MNICIGAVHTECNLEFENVRHSAEEWKRMQGFEACFQNLTWHLKNVEKAKLKSKCIHLEHFYIEKLLKSSTTVHKNNFCLNKTLFVPFKRVEA